MDMDPIREETTEAIEEEGTEVEEEVITTTTISKTITKTTMVTTRSSQSIEDQAGEAIEVVITKREEEVTTTSNHMGVNTMTTRVVTSLTIMRISTNFKRKETTSTETSKMKEDTKAGLRRILTIMRRSLKLIWPQMDLKWCSQEVKRKLGELCLIQKPRDLGLLMGLEGSTARTIEEEITIGDRKEGSIEIKGRKVMDG